MTNEILRVGDGVQVKMQRAEQSVVQEEAYMLGHVHARLYGPDKSLKEERLYMPNLIVDTGRQGIADQLLASPTIPRPTHMGIGSGSTAPAMGNTALVTELTTGGTRPSITRTRSNHVVSMVGSFAAGVGTGSVQEAGIFTATTAGTMYARITFAVINKGANDTLELTWTFTIG